MENKTICKALTPPAMREKVAQPEAGDNAGMPDLPPARFKIGDIVELKSGSVAMTVTAMTDGFEGRYAELCYCANGNFAYPRIHQDALVLTDR